MSVQTESKDNLTATTDFSGISHSTSIESIIKLIKQLEHKIDTLTKTISQTNINPKIGQPLK